MDEFQQYQAFEVQSRFSNFYDNVTTLQPVGVAMLVVALLMLLLLRRDRIFLPFILLTCLAPSSQRLVVAEFDLHFLRLLTLVGWLRIWLRSEIRPLRWTKVDKFVLAWSVASSVVFVLRKGSGGALVNALGQSFDALGLYFLARMVIRDWRDFEGVVRSFAVASIPLAVFAYREVTTGLNPFSYFEGVGEYAIVRDGQVRLKGAYAHQILSGCYWVVPAIWCAGSIVHRTGRAALPAIGMVCSLFIVIASSSSTPFLGVALAIVAACLWPIRKQMQWVRWGMVGCALVLEIIMEKPIWHLYHRITVLGVGGSAGYHRYRLIDAFVNNFKDWAVLGVNDTGRWGRQLDDVTNHFLGQGVRGGFLAFVLFVGIFAYAYVQNGMILRAYGRNWRRAAYAWAVGVALFAQTMMMTATSYYGQILLLLWLSLACIASLTPVRQRRRSASRRARPPPTRREPEPDPEPALPGAAPGRASLGARLLR